MTDSIVDAVARAAFDETMKAIGREWPRWKDRTFDPERTARRAATAAIAAFLEAAREQGWQLVPVEPTVGMCHAMFLAMDKPHVSNPKARAWDCLQGYKASIAAAPSFQESGE